MHLVAEKDAHVLSGAHMSRADVLVTLERRHILTSAVRDGYAIAVQDTHGFFAALRAGGRQTEIPD